MPEKADLANPDSANQSGSASGSVEGQGSSGSDEIQSQLEAVESRRRTLQSLLDQERAKSEKLEGELASLDELSQRVEELAANMKGQQAVSPTDLAAQVADMLSQRESLASYREGLKSRYPGVDVANLRGTTPEELELNAKTEKERVDAWAADNEQRIADEMKAKYEAQYGPLDDDANGDFEDQGDRGSAQGGAITLERFKQMSPEEEAKLPPDEWKRLVGELHAEEGGGTAQ